MAAVIILLQDASDQEIHDPEHAVVSRRTLGAIADMFRRSGVDVHAPNIGVLKSCRVCGRGLDPEKGDVFIGKDGEPYCNDDYPDKEAADG